MRPQNNAHHRVDLREGPYHAWAKRKAGILLKLCAPARVLERLVQDAKPVGLNTYFIPGGAALFLRAKTTLDEFRPLAADEGEVWE
jgi:hypothetical protein